MEAKRFDMAENAKNVALRKRKAETKKVKKAVDNDPDVKDYRRMRSLEKDMEAIKRLDDGYERGKYAANQKRKKKADLVSNSPKTKKEVAKEKDNKTRSEYRMSLVTGEDYSDYEYGMDERDYGNPTEDGFKKYKGKKSLKKNKAKFDAQPKVMAGQKPKAGKVKPLPKKKVRKKTQADRDKALEAQLQRENDIGTFY